METIAKLVGDRHFRLTTQKSISIPIRRGGVGAEVGVKEEMGMEDDDAITRVVVVAVVAMIVQAQMTVVAETSKSLTVSSKKIMLLQPPSHAANIQDVREVVVETREAQEISESERHLRENRNTMLARS
mmetsp:Transcript_9553/g.18631  ORF Transcript_9553/g.18631 Transcript_9553/m.18631 type:complete len:129 (+) Transcript_9553:2673-3059(+)